jgi:hypothetical protein
MTAFHKAHVGIPKLNYASFGIFPGLFDKSHGLRSQNSSLIISTCWIVIFALALLLRSFSSWVFESSISSTVFADSSLITSTDVPGSTNSYWDMLAVDPSKSLEADVRLEVQYFLSCISPLHCCN